jgi:hypothetical protein
MPALALPRSAYSGPTGEDRLGFGGGVCAGEARGLVMRWFGHASVAAASPVARTARLPRAIRVTRAAAVARVTGVTRAGNPRLLDRQDGRHDIGAGVREDGDTR